MMWNTSNVTEDELVAEITEEFRNTVLPVTSLFGVEMAAGIPGNLLTLYVFLVRYKRCNFRYFVLSLALTDLISCFTTIPGEMLSQLFWYSHPSPAVCKIKVFFNQYTVCSEAATLTLIAIDRHRKVCRPFGWQIKQKAAIYACVVIHGVSALLGIPTSIFWGVHSKEIEYKGRSITVTLCEKDETYQHTPFPLINITFNGSIMSVSLLVMFVLYVLVARKLVFSRKFRSTDNVKGTEEATGPTSSSSTGLSNDGASSKMTLSSDALNPIVDNTQPPRRYSVTSTTGQAVHSTTGDYSTALGCATKGTAECGRVVSRSAKKSATVRARRKTLIGFCLTVVFITTTVLYMALISVVATGILARLDAPRKATYFFFLRLYFINHVMNPFLYGLLDPHFRAVMQGMTTRACCC